MTAARANNPEIAADFPPEIDGASLTRSLRDTLDRFVGSSERDPFLRAAGWDLRADAPVDQRSSSHAWLDARLFPLLGERLGLLGAEAARLHLRALLWALLWGETSEPAAIRGEHHAARGPALDEMAEVEHAARSSGIRARRRRSGTHPTYAPPAAVQRLVVWTGAAEMADAIGAVLDAGAEVICVSDGAGLTAAIAEHPETVSLIILDRRGRSSEELRDVSPDDLVGHAVLVWGVPSLDTPDLDRLLCDAGRSVGVAAEAGAGDVADLCAVVLGLRAS